MVAAESVTPVAVSETERVVVSPYLRDVLPAEIVTVRALRFIVTVSPAVGVSPT